MFGRSGGGGGENADVHQFAGTQEVGVGDGDDDGKAGVDEEGILDQGEGVGDGFELGPYVEDRGGGAFAAWGTAGEGDWGAGLGIESERLAEVPDDLGGAIVLDGEQGFAFADELAWEAKERADDAGFRGVEDKIGCLLEGIEGLEEGGVWDKALRGEVEFQLGEAGFQGFDSLGFLVHFGAVEVAGAAAEFEDVGGDEAFLEEGFVTGEFTFGKIEAYLGEGQVGAGLEEFDAKSFKGDGVILSERRGVLESGEVHAGAEAIELGPRVIGLEDGDGIPALDAGVGFDEIGGQEGGLGTDQGGAWGDTNADQGGAGSVLIPETDHSGDSGEEHEDGDMPDKELSAAFGERSGDGIE